MGYLAALSAVALGAAVWAWQLRGAQRRADARAADLSWQCDALRRELVRARWLEWWTRNALETPTTDVARGHFLRWAIAAHAAPDLRTLHCDLRKIADDEARPEHERIHAAVMASELDADRLPWEVWRETGRPDHEPAAMAAAYRAALQGWPALLPSQDDRMRARSNGSEAHRAGL